MNKFLYSFSVWPDETRTTDPAVYALFEFLGGRIEVEFTEEEFQRFRQGLENHGLALHEIERVPYQQPEAIL